MKAEVPGYALCADQAAPAGLRSYAHMSTSDGLELDPHARGPQRPRAGTMPSTFYLGAPTRHGPPQDTSRLLDPLDPSADDLLSPATAGSIRSNLLGRRLSGNPLTFKSNNYNNTAFTAPDTPASINHRSSPIDLGPLALDGIVLTPMVTLNSSSDSLTHNTASGSSNGASGIPSISTTTTSDGVSPSELRASLLRSSQPVSPDPVAAARLRSGSLTLPPSGLGNGFRPGFYGPPGSGTGSWTPRSTGMGTPLAAPGPSDLIPDENGGPSESILADEPDHPPPTAAIGGILEFLDKDESTIPATLQQHTLPRSAGNTPRHTSPTSARQIPLAHPSAATSSNSFLAAAAPRPASHSISVPSSAHPSIQNIRQAYLDHSPGVGGSSSSSLMVASPSATSSAPDFQLPLSPRSAARLRANTVAATEAPIIRDSSSYYLSPNASAHNANGFHSPSLYGSVSTMANGGEVDLNNYMSNLNLSDQQHLAAQQQYHGGYSPATNAYLFSPNRPRASTIGILDEPNAAATFRRRAGTTGPGMMPSGLRTPIYDGGQDGYMATGDVAEADEEYMDANGREDPWTTSHTTPDSGYIHETYMQPVQFGERTATPPPHQHHPTRSLWIGNVDDRVTAQDLVDNFAVYGQIESIRLLSEKECAFVNFTTLQEATDAKEDVLNRLNGQISVRAAGVVTVRIGFGKAASAPATPANRTGTGAGVTVSSPMVSLTSNTSNSELSIQTAPTRALWLGSIPSTVTSADLLKVFSPYGAIESARVLVHKQCGFINFENLDDAVAARKALNGQEVLGPEIGPIKIGFAKVPTKMPDTPVFDNNMVDPTAAYQALKRLGGATAVPLEEQLSSGHLENFRSPMALQLAANGLNGLGPHSAAGLTQSLQPAVALSPSVVASEFGGDHPPQGVPLPSISEQQILVKELSGDTQDAEAHAHAISEPRPLATYSSVLPHPPEEYAHIRNRNLDTPRLRDIRKRLEAPASQVPQAEIDGLAADLLDECVALSSDYIGNVIIQKLFERCSSSLRFAMLERVAPFLAYISCHKNGTWAAQKIIDTVSSPQEISLVCRNLQPYVPALLLDQFGNYAAQLSLRFFSPMSDFLFDAMIDRCWEIASGRFGARSVRTCLEHPNATSLQQKRVAVSIILNSVNLATNPNGALLLTWLLDTSNLPGRYRLLATRLAPHLALLCPHKVASTTILKIVNQKVDPASSRMITNAVLGNAETSILDDILAEQVHGSAFVHKLLGSAYLNNAVREQGIQRIRAILQKGSSHHSPAYAKLCHEVGLPAPLAANGMPHTPPPPKAGRGGFAAYAHHTPHPLSANNIPNSSNPISPPFAFPSFGSPISPAPRSAPGMISSAGHNYVPRQASPFQPMFGARNDASTGRRHEYREMHNYVPSQPSSYQSYSSHQPSTVQHVNGKQYPTDVASRHNAILPSLASGAQQSSYADQYIQNVAALQMANFAGYTGFEGTDNFSHSPVSNPYGHAGVSSAYPSGYQPSQPYNQPY